MGVEFDRVTLTETLDRLDTMVASRRPHYVVTPNVDFVVQAQRDAELRHILNTAQFVLCDGKPLVWVSRLLGRPLPERVAGSDLVPRLIRGAAQRNHRLFFLGASSEANAQAVANVRTRFPNLTVEGYAPPFRPWSETDQQAICDKIRIARPDIVLVAFGCPKAEKWMARNYRILNVPVVMGIGGTIDFLAGRLKRAPVWMQHAGLEWLFRLIQEPRRLFRRYAADLWHFGWALSRQLCYVWLWEPAT